MTSFGCVGFLMYACGFSVLQMRQFCLFTYPPRWANDFSSAADNAIFKNRAQNIECSFGCVLRSAVLLKSYVAKSPFPQFNFCRQKFVQHGPITITIDFNDLSLLIFEEKWSNYASASKFAPNTDSFWVRRLFNVCVRVFCRSICRNLLV